MMNARIFLKKLIARFRHPRVPVSKQIVRISANNPFAQSQVTFKKYLLSQAKLYGGAVLLICGLSLSLLQILPKSNLQKTAEKITQPAKASYQYTATGGTLVTGTEVAIGADSQGWRGARGSDNNMWSTTRTASGLNKQLQFDGIELQGGNKIIITIEDANVTTGDAYTHQICDWSSSSNVDNAADAQCTGGGWRTLVPRKANLVNTADTVRDYEVYDGYFSTRSSSPGTFISTPLATNFIKSPEKRILIRVYSTVNSAVQHNIDNARVTVAVDPIYEPAALNLTSAGATTNYVSDLVGPTGTNVIGSDNNRMTIPMPGNSQAADFYFTFKNVKTYEGMNTFVVMPEFCQSNATLTVGLYAWNFQSSQWVQNDVNFTTSTCATDTDFARAFNSTSMSGFVLSNYISNGEIRIRFLTSSPAATYNLQIDRIYLMLGSVNADSQKCEISFGTGTATNCTNTRTTLESKVAAPAGSTWQATAALEYPAGGFYALDNDDDATDAEYAASQNMSFPITVDKTKAVTAIHYAAKYRSNNAAQTADLQIRVYSGLAGTSGWINTPGTDTNLSTTYGWYDSWNLAEYETSPDDSLDTVNNLANLRLRTSAGTTTNPGSRDWAFAMMSIRWVEESSRLTVSSQYTPTGGYLPTGVEQAGSQANMASWKATIGTDNNTWNTARSGAGSGTTLNKQLYFDGVKLYTANKLIISIEDRNITTANVYEHQICDWVSTTGVKSAADSDCTGGGWRNMHPRDTTYTDTTERARDYEIFNGYFSSRSSSPGTAYDTPLSNFVRPSDKRVLIRVFSTVASSSVVHEMDYARVTVATDPYIEPAQFINTSGGTPTNYISDLVGATGTSINASDGNKFQVAMPGVSQAIDARFVFKNIQTYTGMNTFLISPEICVSNVALTFDVYLWNYTNSSWTQLNYGITESTCTTDTEYAFAFNSTTIGGFVFSDYISNGQTQFRILTNAPAGSYNIQLDRMYMLLGSVNSDNSQCEISFGTGTATNCSNTRSVYEGKTATPASSTWQATAVTEYPASQYPLDNDDDATSSEYAASQNLSFPITVNKNSTVTAIHYAVKFRSNNAAQTAEPQIRDYSGISGTSGWVNTPGADTNLATTYSWYDSWTLAEYETSPDDAIDTANNVGNLRLRTSAGTTTDPGTRDWDFAMMSIRWLDTGITVSGSAYETEGGSDWTGCNGSTTNVSISVNGGSKVSGICDASTGAFSIDGVVPTAADQVLAIYMDSGGGDKGVTYTRNVTTYTDISGIQLVKNRTWVQSETATAISGTDIALYDQTNDGDIPVQSSGAQTVGIGTPTTSTANGGTTLTFAHNVTGSNRLLIVGVSYRASSISSVTYNGVGLTKVRTDSNTERYTDIWYLTNPATGSNNVQINFNAESEAIVAGAVTFTNVNQSSPLGNNAGNTGSATSQTVTLSSNSSELVFGLSTHYPNGGGNTPSNDVGQTSAWSLQNGAALVWGIAATKTGAASTTLTWTSPQSFTWSASAVAIKPIDETLVLDSGVELHINTGDTFAPAAADVSAPNVHIKGTYTGASGDLTLTGSGSGACSTEPGTIRPLCIDSGVFTAPTTTTYSGTAASTVEATTYNALGIGTTSDSNSGVTYTLRGNTTVTDAITIGNASSTNTDTLSASSYTLTLSGTSEPLHITSKGSFDAATSTTEYSGNTAKISPATYYNLNAGAAVSQTVTLATQTTSQSDSTNSLSFSHSSTGGNRLLLVAIAYRSGTISTVTYNGASLAPIRTDTNTDRNTSLWYVASPASGSNTVVINFSATGNSVTATAMTFNNVNQTSPLGNNAGNTGNSTTPSVVVSSSASELVIGHISTYPDGSGNSVTSDLGQTDIWNDKTANTLIQNHGAYKTGAASTTMSWTGTEAFTWSASAIALKPAPATYQYLGTASSQTINVSHNFIAIGAVDAEQYDPVFDVNGNLNINSTGLYSASSSAAFTLGTNFTNDGLFTSNSGEITFDSASTAVISSTANMSFYNFKSVTAGKTIKFQKHTTNVPTFTINGLLTLTGASGNYLYIESDTAASKWLVNHQGTESVSFVSLRDAGCSSSPASTQITASDAENRGNNDACWVFAAPSGITVSGFVYSDESSTAWTGAGKCDGSTAIVSLSLNGAAKQSTTCNNTTGAFSFSGLLPAGANELITIYIDGHSTDKGVLYTKNNDTSTNITGLPLTKQRVWIQSESSQSITNSNINTYDVSQDVDIPANSNGTTLTVDTGYELHINTSDTFAPGGNVTANNLHVKGTYTGSSETLTLDGSGTGNCTTAPGTIRPLCIDSGSFAAPSTVNFTGTSGDSTVEGSTYSNIGIGTTSDSSTGRTFTLGGNSTVSSVLTIGNAASTNTDTFSGSTYTLTLTGSGTPVVVTAKGTLGGATSTINYTGGAHSSTVTIASSYTYYNLGLGTTADANSVTYSNSGFVVVENILTIGNAGSTGTGDTYSTSSTALNGGGSPLVITSKGTLSSSGSFGYTGITTQNVTPATYYDLDLATDGAGPITLGTAGSQTINVLHNLNMDTADNRAIIDANTYDPTLDVNGNFFIGTSGTEFSASNTAALNIAGNFDNQGTFTANSGEVTIDGAGTSVITSSSDMSFSSFKSVTAGKTIKFQKHTANMPTFTISGVLTLTGSNGNSINIESDTASSQWLINHQGTESVSYINVKDSGCSGSSTNITTANSTNLGNNGQCWNAGVVVSGNVYSDETPTAWTGAGKCDGSTAIVSISVNGGTKQSTTCNGSTGAFSLYVPNPGAANQVIATYIDGHSADKGVLYTKNSDTTSAISNLALTKNRVWIQSESAQSITNSNINTYDKTNDADITAASDGTVLSVDSGHEIHINSSDTFAPGGNVSASNIHIKGTYAGSAETLALDGSGSGNCTTAPGTIRPLCVDSGSFTAPTTVNFTTTAGDATIESGTYQNLGIGTTSDSSTGRTFSLIGNTTVAQVLTVGNASSTNQDIISLGSYTLTLSGSGTPFNITTKGGCVPGTSTVNYTGTSATNVSDGDYYNLGVGTSADANSVSYTMYGLSNSIFINNNLVVGNASSTGSGDTLVANSRLIILGGSGTPFTITAKGAFQADTSSFTYGTGDTNLNITPTTYYDLKIVTQAINVVAGTAPGQTITVLHNLTHDENGEGATFDANTYDPIIDINGNLDIITGSVFEASSSSSFTIGGNFTNSGTFNANGGTVTIDGAGTSTISSTANITFNNLTSTTAGKTIKFQKHTANVPKFTVNGALTLTGTNGNEILVESDTAASKWLINHQGTESVSYTSVKDSGCSSSPASTTITTTHSINRGNNDACWTGFTGGGSPSVDIVDSGGSSVGSPAVPLSNTALSFTCQTTTGTLGTSNQKIRISSPGSADWTVDIAATSGSTSNWQDGGLHFDYNDTGSSGCGDSGDADSLGGQLSVDPSSLSLSPQGGCSTSGISSGSPGSFAEGSTNTISLLSATGAQSNCYYDVTGINVQQKIPAEQTGGNYSLDLTITVIAN